MPRLFLAWAAFLAAASWIGIALAEVGRFAAPIPVASGLVAAALTWRAIGREKSPIVLPGASAVGVIALVAALSLAPPVDTTLLSQDASLHRLAGIELARSGSLAVHDPVLDGLPESERRDLFERGATGLLDVSRSRLPGGLVIPSDRSSLVVPSFAHLLAVWIAIVDGLLGESAIGWLGPLFAATAWWAIGLVALAQAGLASAAATIALLATWLPQHWFGRFLMPEVLAEALVWGGVAAATLAPSRARPNAAAAIAGACLGVACFARLEQLAILPPALLLARALLPSDRPLLPRAAVPWFALAAVHAAVHLAIVPTDYGKRMTEVATGALARAWMLLGGTPVRVAFATLALGLAAFVGGRWLHHRSRGLETRVAAGIAGALAFAAIVAGNPPSGLPALDWLSWYVPWPAWLAAALGVLPFARPSGLGLALFIEACDQVVSPRVTPEQVWGARRLVVVVLPLVALAAGWAIARRDRPRSATAARVGLALVAAAVVLGLAAIRPVLGRRLQHGSAAFARELDGALPPEAAVLVAPSLDWIHLAPVLWRSGRRDVLVARTWVGFPAAAARLLAVEEERGRPLFLLSGAMVEPGASVPPGSLDGILPAGWTIEPVRGFSFGTRMLERTSDHAPAEVAPWAAELTLHRLRRVDAPLRGGLR